MLFRLIADLIVKHSYHQRYRSPCYYIFYTELFGLTICYEYSFAGDARIYVMTDKKFLFEVKGQRA
jgi:hypothetical protein